jgi:hypothetical protein
VAADIRRQQVDARDEFVRLVDGKQVLKVLGNDSGAGGAATTSASGERQSAGRAK